MSAIIAVRSAETIHILTDAAMTHPEDGLLVTIQPKQVITQNGLVLAGVGPWAPIPRFAKLVDMRTKNLDEFMAASVQLWQEARAAAQLPERTEKLRYATIIAGWSEATDRLAIALIQPALGHSPTDLTAFDIYDASGYVGVPVPFEECEALVAPFLKRFDGDPDAFDPHRDGLELMETLRQRHFLPFEQGRRPAVGGYVQHTTVRRDHIRTEIIKHWPDVVGRHIKLDAQPPDRNVFGLPWAEHLQRREAIVREEWRAGQVTSELWGLERAIAIGILRGSEALMNPRLASQ